MHQFRIAPAAAAVSLSALLAFPAVAIILPQTHPAALDQPRINAALFRPADPDTPLADTSLGFPVHTIQAFFDTGASGILISSATAAALNVQALLNAAGPGGFVEFRDVGVGGFEAFHVSELLYVGIAPFPGQADADGNIAPADFIRTASPVRLQMQIPPGNDPLSDLDILTSALDVFGIPLMQGQVVVINGQPTDASVPFFADPFAILAGGELGDDVGYMETYVYAPGTPFTGAPGNPGIPATSHQVRLSFADFSGFTQILPDGSFMPVLAQNPFVGPNPLADSGAVPTDADPPPVTVGLDGQSASGSFLFDTGAGVSMISSAIAAALDVTYNADRSQLVRLSDGTALSEQFSLTIGGVGGSQQVRGFYLDYLVLPTVQGDAVDLNDPNHLRFIRPAVLVADISLEHPATHEIFTLDGILGMNLLAASGYLNEDDLPAGLSIDALLGGGDITDIDQYLEDLLNIPVDQLLGLASLILNLDARESAFNWIVFDQPSGLLGLDVKPHLVPEPATAALMAMGAAGLLRRRRR